MPAAPSQPHPPPPKACPECAYSLAGLPPLSRDHPCPECGFPASHLAPPDAWLRNSDRRWLRRVTLGLRLSLFSARWLLGLVILAMATVVVVPILEIVGGISDGESDTSWPIDAAIWSLIATGVIAHSASCALLASRPTEPHLERPIARRTLRIGGMLFAPALALTTVGPIFTGLRPAERTEFALASGVAALALVYLTAQILWTRALAFNTESWQLSTARLYRRPHRQVWGIILAGAAFDLFIFSSLFDRPPTDAHGPGGPLWLWLAPLAAFVTITELTTKPALRSLNSELKPPPRATTTPPPPSPR